MMVSFSRLRPAVWHAFAALQIKTNPPPLQEKSTAKPEGHKKTPLQPEPQRGFLEKSWA
jgi:hypothetical protein